MSQIAITHKPRLSARVAQPCILQTTSTTSRSKHKDHNEKYLREPKPAPLTLKLPPPVFPRFSRAPAETPLRSYEPASVSLPSRTPLVINTIKLPSSPAATLHVTDESEAHVVTSADVLPKRTRPLNLRERKAREERTNHGVALENVCHRIGRRKSAD